MQNKYPEYENLDLPKLASEIEKWWKKEDIFQKSVDTREGKTPFVFYEGPPSANGMPGIHHVMGRTIKDIFCRYKTQKGFQVKRKAGWDTHGLPIELGVEKELGITKEDIGTKITIDEYNQACRNAVLKYTDVWNDLTQKMGYWVDMNDPYITYDNKYIESVWWLLRNMYDKGLMYKGYTIQPYSPAAGTGLSSHEINQPGCYKPVKDNTIVAMFKLKETEQKTKLFGASEVHTLAWTTTPWTLSSNTALTVGPNIDYVLVKSFNTYDFKPMQVILAKNLVGKHFNEKAQEIALTDYKPGDKLIPYQVIQTFKGKDLLGLSYEQLLPYALPNENPEKAFVIIGGDFVTTEDGTGIVHTAPTFGADDMKVAKDAGVPPMLVVDETGKGVPLVDLRGRYRAEMHDAIFGFGGEFVKEEYLSDQEKQEELKKQQERLKNIIPKLDKYLSVDERIALKLKTEGKAFKIEKYEHTYPHCWRTDKPILYYPLDSWFINIPKVRDRLVALNKTINWKPESTGTGRFGNWLENANDWNLSRSRYWGIPLPIWRAEDGEEKCIGSISELKEECEKATKAGVMKNNPLANFNAADFSAKNYSIFDLHRPYVDDILLVSATGKPMKRETDLIDVWFDSGAMPYAQVHYPFENKELIDQNKFFPADFIAEGVDQTRGWFYTLHAIATACFDSVAYKNVVSNGLVLDKNGQKMSKRLGNAIDPFKTLETYGPDATRFYMITNAQPWDNLKFDLEGIVEVQRKFFRALHNTYAFFALYANVDQFTYKEVDIKLEDRPEIDRWILSRLNSLIQKVDGYYADYEPTKAGREIQNFVVDELSNWYVRLCRKRFWRGDYGQDKISAYQTLYRCLEVVAPLVAPIAPFYAEKLFQDLNKSTSRNVNESVHLAIFPTSDASMIDLELENRMELAQRISSMILSIRKKEKLKVRQPLQKIIVPSLNEKFSNQLQAIQDLILTEVNVKELEIITETNGILTKKIKPDFKKLGPKFGKLMKEIASIITEFDQAKISEIEKNGKLEVSSSEGPAVIELEDVEITSQDIPGWQVMTENGVTVALDITLSDTLIEEGLARELINRIQNFRKDIGLDVTDRITLHVQSDQKLNEAIQHNLDYICSETLTSSLQIVDKIQGESLLDVEIDEDIKTKIAIFKN